MSDDDFFTPADEVPLWGARGPVDQYGRPLMPTPVYVGDSSTPVPPVPPSPPSPPSSPSPPPPPSAGTGGAADPLPPPLVPIDRHTPWRGTLDCGLEAWRAEHGRLASPIPADQQELCYYEVKPWSAQCLATGVKETELGKTASGDHNFLNLFVPEGTGPKDFPSWSKCAIEWFARFKDPTYKNGVYMPRDASVEQMIATYQGGPGCWTSKGQSCANGEGWVPCQSGSIELSIQQFVARCNTYMGHSQSVPWSPVPGGAGCEAPPLPDQPPIYDLVEDGGRWGVTPNEAYTLRQNCFPHRSGQRATAIVLHVQEGTTAGSLDWWLYGGGQASSTVMIQQDGSILNVIPEADGPWTNGDTCTPTPRGQQFLSSCHGANPNLFSLTIEFEGYYNQGHSAAQIEAGVWQVLAWQARYGIGCDRVLAHRDINQCSRANCCGATLFNGVLSGTECSHRW